MPMTAAPRVHVMAPEKRGIQVTVSCLGTFRLGARLGSSQGEAMGPSQGCKINASFLTTAYCRRGMIVPENLHRCLVFVENLS